MRAVSGAPRRVHGVDFSGASDAGRKLWVASGEARGGALRVEALARGDALPGSGPGRTEAHAALVAFIAARPGETFGCDIPFGVAAQLARAPTWDAWVRAFRRRYASAGAFRAACARAAGGRELKRWTDVHAGTPLSPTNLRVHLQTFHGVRDVLAPLLARDAIRVVPMQRPSAGRATVLEACPASVLKRRGLYLPYKGRGAAERRQRAAILAALEGAGVELGRAEQRAALRDPGGDALDAILAALAAARAHLAPAPPRGAPWRVEGYVYSGAVGRRRARGVTRQSERRVVRGELGIPVRVAAHP